MIETDVARDPPPLPLRVAPAVSARGGQAPLLGVDAAAVDLNHRVHHRLAVVFGAGSIGPGWGNGKATAALFARHGAHVACVDVNPAAAEETAGIIAGEGGRASAHACDVTDSDAVARLVAGIASDHGRIDVLHNNVGYATMGGPVELSEADWQRTFDLNVKGCFITCM